VSSAPSDRVVVRDHHVNDAEGGKGRRLGDLRSFRARVQLRGGRDSFEARVERGPGAEAAPLPASPPRT